MKLKLTTNSAKSAHQEVKRLLEQFDTITVQQDERKGEREIKVYVQNASGSRLHLPIKPRNSSVKLDSLA